MEYNIIQSIVRGECKAFDQKILNDLKSFYVGFIEGFGFNPFDSDIYIDFAKFLKISYENTTPEIIVECRNFSIRGFLIVTIDIDYEKMIIYILERIGFVEITEFMEMFPVDYRIKAHFITQSMINTGELTSKTYKNLDGIYVSSIDIKR